MFKKLCLLACVSLALVGCKDRVIWNDNGKVDDATENREVWNTQGELDKGERKIWTDKDGNDVVK
ncbi:MAG: hypothetical protein ACPHQ9_06135 [Marinobacter sp.]|uniref:hypothetical protein n=1 Tax=Marinobacter sp. TaxID=50741 RepID=UPI001B272F88|nr:hypothetical protein [Marinobacter sp.]